MYHLASHGGLDGRHDAIASGCCAARVGTGGADSDAERARHLRR
jgi:hypothetical protein